MVWGQKDFKDDFVPAQTMGKETFHHLRLLQVGLGHFQGLGSYKILWTTRAFLTGKNFSPISTPNLLNPTDFTAENQQIAMYKAKINWKQQFQLSSGEGSLPFLLLLSLICRANLAGFLLLTAPFLRKKTHFISKQTTFHLKQNTFYCGCSAVGGGISGSLAFFVLSRGSGLTPGSLFPASLWNSRWVFHAGSSCSLQE